MSVPLEDYALLGDTRTAALVARNGSIDWLCLPRFDSAACFAALLGDTRHGRWQLTPKGEVRATRRRYREQTLVLETELSTDAGRVKLIDCMLMDQPRPHLVRIVEGVSGEVAMRMELIIRMDYGWVVPWVSRATDGVLHAVGGPDALALHTPVQTRGENLTTVADFSVHAGQRISFVLSWHPSHEPVPAPLDALAELQRTESWWRRWAAQCTYRGEWEQAVIGSLVVLKALTYAPTGGIVAAPTTSLPEALGGVRNWDYRYCWLRDATFTLYALLLSGFRNEASAWRDWLLRAVAGSPSQIQILYGVAGERRIPEMVLDWLPGYAGSAPVRVGNAAVHQLQLDVHGELTDALYYAARSGLELEPTSWSMMTQLIGFLESNWREPDQSIWEMRGPAQQFTHSKMMAWVAFDRMVKCVERLGMTGPLERWRRLRDEIHLEVCSSAYDARQQAFTQAYGSSKLDAALLMMPLVGFLPPSDPRVVGTVRAIERDLLHDGLVLRYRSDEALDGLPPGEGVFLACSFWLADNYALMGRTADARALFERLLGLRNDVGLLAEEYDPAGRCLLGNFPQAFSHVGLINTGFNLTPRHPTPAAERADGPR